MHDNDTYYFRGELVEGKAIKVFTRDRVGALTGEYDGYFKPSRRTLMLYPAKGSYKYGRLQKHEVSIYLLRRSG